MSTVIVVLQINNIKFLEYYESMLDKLIFVFGKINTWHKWVLYVSAEKQIMNQSKGTNVSRTSCYLSFSELCFCVSSKF